MLRTTGLIGFLGVLLFAPAVEAAWQVVENEDDFTDEIVVTAAVVTAHNDRLSVQCDGSNSIVFVYGPGTRLRADEVVVRYRVDKEPPVESALEWENHNGRARVSLATKKSLFGEGGQDEELLNLLQALIRGGSFVIEADGERARFSLRGSEQALLAVLGSCGIEINP
ncbi:MAG: hypothetical protein ACTSX7_04705 [Alphaproteobacteria bacterium]